MIQIPGIRVKKQDLIWNYIGTAFSMGSSFLLLPILVHYLSDEALGFWYSLTAISNFTTLFEFGFNPTFARNIVYCLSGAKSLSLENISDCGDQVDWHLTATVIKTSRCIYAAISVFALFIVGTVGSAYIAAITSDLNNRDYWIAWVIFIVSITLNLFYLWTLTVLRGCGDIAGENKAKTYSKIAQLIITFTLCAFGLGIVGAAIGYLANGLFLRLFAWKEIKTHDDVYRLGVCNKEYIKWREIRDVLSSVVGLTVRDGVVELSLFLATQSASLLCSYRLGLSVSGIYSIQLQLANAVSTFSAVYISSCYPTYQSAFARKSIQSMKGIVERGITAYWACAILGVTGVLLVAFPLLPIIRPSVQLNAGLFVALALYSCIVQQTSAFCSLIAATNQIPYAPAYLVSSFVGIILSWLFIEWVGVWGLVIGQLVSQIVYNAWYWPRLVLNGLNLPLKQVFTSGAKYWLDKLSALK